MLVSTARTRVLRLVKDEQGSSTVEFSILFPGLIFLIAGCIWLSVYVITIGNVQQLTYEVARQALQHRVAAPDHPALCRQVGDVLVPEMVTTLTLIDPDKITGLSCSPAEIPGWSRVTLTYDASSIGFSPLIRAFNGGSDVIVGRALIMGG
ncbi:MULTISPECIES: TadE/TadG family type IV pilus assembly protein [Mameliella]|uniref:TadE/TadG family type IV pilus assembly protein n=1 Tax=Mameliella TaxID=1434019 RepID=UPI00084119F8|nr:MULTISPECIES: TadE family protein [Mameliella]MCR9272023.1 pilus assembly protein [Paracoccaceae bacterium]ODM49209.1 hypothetical protein A9320_16795 [Ruegeria sp. PBVC088]MBY6119714.1 pilus assembly protein [Mameliella alba]MDD9731304.1 pilus assembly protein [Mameliella sp. AT18]PTR42677.1 TadE-like protein [Mameliella alba]